MDQRSGHGRFGGRFLNPRAQSKGILISRIFRCWMRGATFVCWKIRFKIEVCTCSQFPAEAMLWIKEVEMVESVDDLKSPRSIRGTHGTYFEVLDAKIASDFKKKGSLEEQKAQKEDRFFRGRQIAHLIYEYFRVTGAHETVLGYADLFTITLRNDIVQEFETRWDEILLSMTKIPTDDVLESLNKLRIRESVQLKTVLELYDMEIHQKISMPKNQKLEDDGAEKKRSETQMEKLLTPDMREYKREQWLRIAGD